MPKPPKKPEQAARVAPKRGSEERRGTRVLPKHFNDLATGERDRVRTPRVPRERLRDDRERVAIVGVNNRDARLVYDARVQELRETKDEAALARGLLDVFQLGLWRARAITGFDAFCNNIIDISPNRGIELARRAAAEAGQELRTLPDTRAALWLRTESAVREHAPDGQVRLLGAGDQAQLEVRVPLEPALAAVGALAGVGRQAAGLGRHLSPTMPPRPDGQARADDDRPGPRDRWRAPERPRWEQGPPDGRQDSRQDARQDSRQDARQDSRQDARRDGQRPPPRRGPAPERGRDDWRGDRERGPRTQRTDGPRHGAKPERFEGRGDSGQRVRGQGGPNRGHRGPKRGSR